jgi:hypothetical protein
MALLPLMGARLGPGDGSTWQVEHDQFQLPGEQGGDQRGTQPILAQGDHLALVLTDHLGA